MEDYPLRVTHHEVAGGWSKHRPRPWTVAIINWFQMRGDGESTSAARDDLAQRFTEYVASGQPLPRPGTGRPVELTFAATDEIDKLDDLAREFMPMILRFERADCLITDESTIADFPESDEEYLRRIGVVYGLHPSEFNDLKLITILKKIAEKRRGA